MVTSAWSSLVLAGIALGLITEGCVVYRDRIIMVSQRTELEIRPGGAIERFETVSLGSVPARLDGERIEASLAGYGQWLDDPTLGPVWIPGQNSGGGSGFVPYVTAGRWISTNAGWYWQSDLPWGRVAFHYGRWVSLSQGWAWVPGSAFAPAWVEWRSGNGWFGWAPLGPVGYGSPAPFAYCSSRSLVGAGLASRVVMGDGAMSLFSRTEPIDPAPGYGGAVYSHGPTIGAGLAIPSVSLASVWSRPSQPATRVGVPFDDGPATPQQQRISSRVLADRIAAVPSVLPAPSPHATSSAPLSFVSNDPVSAPGAFSVVHDPAGNPRFSTVSLGTTSAFSSSPPSLPSPPSQRSRSASSVAFSPTTIASGSNAAPRFDPTLPELPPAFGSSPVAQTIPLGERASRFASPSPHTSFSSRVATAPPTWAPAQAPGFRAPFAHSSRAVTTSPSTVFSAPASTVRASPLRVESLALPRSPIVQPAPRNF